MASSTLKQKMQQLFTDKNGIPLRGTQIAELTELSQSAVSRLFGKGPSTYTPLPDSDITRKLEEGLRRLEKPEQEINQLHILLGLLRTALQEEKRDSARSSKL
jgi:hypothetical protein